MFDKFIAVWFVSEEGVAYNFPNFRLYQKITAASLHRMITVCSDVLSAKDDTLTLKSGEVFSGKVYGFYV